MSKLDVHSTSDRTAWSVRKDGGVDDCLFCPYYGYVSVGVSCLYPGGPKNWVWDDLLKTTSGNYPAFHPDCPAPRIPDGHDLSPREDKK